MKYTFIDEALQNPKDVTELYLSGEECKKANTDEIKRLVNVKKLSFFPKTDQWEKLPGGFKDLSLNEVCISGVRVNELIGLNLKTLHITMANIDFVPLCKNFPMLEELAIATDQVFDIPDEIANLQNLKKLTLRSGKLGTVSPEISKLESLRTLSLTRLGFREFPVEFSMIPQLEELELNYFPQLMHLPDEFANLKALKKLHLVDIFKNREASNSFEEEMDDLFEDPESVNFPKVIGSLTNLEYFESSFCPFANLDALSSLKKLKTIIISQAQLENIKGIKNLECLEKLDLANAYNINEIATISTLINLKYLSLDSTKIKDLTPLQGLKQLEYLNVRSCPFDSSKVRIKAALAPLFGLENLKEIESLHYSKEDWENRDKSEVISNKLSKEEILFILKGNTANLDKVEQALNSIEDIEDVFDVDKYDADDSALEIELLDNAINIHIKELSEKTLIRLVQVTFADDGMGDSYNATVLAIKELIERKSVEGQLAVVEAFKNCSEYYDTGHRYWGSTVQDQLIDNLFPSFELEPLAQLVLWLDGNFLSTEYGDSMENLYVPLFEKMKNSKYEREVLEHFKSYVFKYSDNDSFDGLFKGILEQGLSELLKAEVEALKGTIEIIKNGLTSGDAGDFNRLLAEIGKSVPLHIFNEFDIRDGFKKINIKECPITLLAETLNKVIQLEETNHISAIIKVMFEIDQEKTKSILQQFAEEDEKSKERLIELLNVDVSSREEDYITKETYEDFSKRFSYALMGKTEEDIQKELEEKKAAEERKKQHDSEKKVLKNEFENAMSSLEYEPYISISEKVVIESKYAEKYSFDMASYVTKLIINALQRSEFEKSRLVILSYINTILPNVGTSHKISDVASNSLVYAIIARDKEIEELVFAKLLPQDLKAEDVDNEMLAFNLSCFYALKGDKKELLPYVKQSLNLGKPSEQFLSDTDFKKFWNDEDFLAILKH